MPTQSRPPLVAVPARRAGRVLVLGAGFIGAHVAHRLIESGVHVDVVSRSEPSPATAPLLEGASVLVRDVTTMTAVTALLAQVDHVVYAVGSSSPVESDLDPASDVALVVPPVVRLLELLRLRSSVGLTYISSGGAVYGNVAAPKAREDTTPEPISSYGILKLTAERYIAMYSRLYDLPAQILRVSNVYGPGQPWAKGQGIVARLMRCAMTGERFPIYGAGDNIRDYIFIDDVAAAIADLVFCEGQTVVNVGSGVGHSIIEVVHLVEEVSGRRIEIEHLDNRTFDVRSIVLDVDRLRGLIDFQPRDLRTGLQRTWASLSDEDLSTGSLPGLIRMPGAGR